MARSSRREPSLIALYLGAIVTANLVVARYGQAALPFTAFVLVPFDLVTRDVLHEHWVGRALWRRMLTLIAAGSVLAAALNTGAAMVALASFVSFSVANLVNAGAFHALHGKVGRYSRMSASNFLAAGVDSLIFPAIAFNSVDYRLSLAQWASKFVGGLVFAGLFVWYDTRTNDV